MTHCGLFWVMAASPSLPVVPGTGSPALTRARPERAARMTAECIVEFQRANMLIVSAYQKM